MNVSTSQSNFSYKQGRLIACADTQLCVGALAEGKWYNGVKTRPSEEQSSSEGVD
jgi:hypothetical protein